MTDRSVVYRLRAEISGLTGPLRQAGASVHKFGDDLTSIDAKGEKMRRGLEHFGTQAGRTALLLGGAFAGTVVKAANFEQAMSYVEAATHETSEAMGQLRQAALDAGAQTAFSATEAAGAIENLSKAGVSTADILGGALSGSLDLAAAGGLDVATAAEFMATAMTQFQLEGDRAAHVADLLAAGAGKAQGEVSDMANALNYAGVPAANLGVSIEETTGVIALFAKNGIIGEQAGTSLRGMLASLTSPSQAAKKEMKELGISVFDAKGKFIGFDGIAGQLHNRLGRLTDAERANALGRIFGNEQLQAANVLYREGAGSVREWEKNVNDAGYASETAAIRMDNLKGDLEQLGGALETAFITGGSGQTGILRDLVQDITSLVDAFNELPEPVQEAAVALTGVGAVGAGGFWFTSKAVTSIADTRQALQDLGLRSADTERRITGLGVATRGIAGAAGLGLLVHGATQADESLGALELAAGGALAGFAVGGPWGAAIGGTAGALWGLAGASDGAAQSVSDSLTTWQTYRDTLSDVSGAVTAATKAMLVQDLQQSGLLEQVGEVGVDPQMLVNGILGQGKAREKLAAALQQQKDELTALGKAEYEKHKDDKKWDRDTTDFLKRRWDIIDAIEAETGELQEAAKARIQEIALTNQLPEEVVTEFITNAPQTARDVAVLAEQYDLQPPQVRTILRLLGVNASMEDIKRIRAALRETNGIRANPSVSVSGIGTALAGIRTLRSELAGLGNPKVHVPSGGGLSGLLGGPREQANGGVWSGGVQAFASGGFGSDGRYYARDSQIVAGGANILWGEKETGWEAYISGKPSQRSRNVDIWLETGRRLGVGAVAADGGTAGKNPTWVSAIGGSWGDAFELPKTLKGLNKALKRSKDSLEDETKARDDLASTMSSLRDAVSGKLTSDLFGETDPWSKGGSFEDVMAKLNGDIANSKALSSNIAALKSKGLNGAALDALLAEGDLATIGNFAALSAAQLAQYERQYEVRASLATSTANSAANAAYGPEFKVLDSSVRRLEAQVKAIEKAIDRNGKANREARKRGAGAGARNRKNG